MDVFFGLVVGLAVGAAAILIDRAADHWRARWSQNLQRRGLIGWLLDRHKPTGASDSAQPPA